MVPPITTFWLASLGFWWSFQHQFSHIFFLWQAVNCCQRQKQKSPFTQPFGNIVTFSCQSTKWPQTISWGDSLIPGHISCDQLTAPPSTHSSFFLMIEASRELYLSYHQDCSFQKLDIYIYALGKENSGIFLLRLKVKFEFSSDQGPIIVYACHSLTNWLIPDLCWRLNELT